MKKYILLFIVLAQTALFAQNTHTIEKPLKLSKAERGVKNDSLLVWQGISKLVKHLPVSEIKTNLDFVVTPTGGTVFSSTGNDAALPLATTSNAGLLSPSEKTKLGGIASGATANQTDAYLLSRANHTGTQAISTVTGLQTALDNKINTTLINANNGVAPLDAGGKVPFANLPASLMIYKGMWNPTTNTPTLANGTGTAGWVYKTSTNGTVNLGSGNISFFAGDFVIHNGTTWERSVGTDNVVSVNNQQGVVSLTTSNIADSADKRYQTDSQKLYNDATSSIQNQLNGKQSAGSYEPAFAKNTAFNKNFGTAAGTVAEGNDSRINNGQTAFGWGNHALAGYLPSASYTAADVLTKTKTVDGSGSGLDADLLDGLQGSNYATLTSLNNYLPLTGGTLTGGLNVPSFSSIMIGSLTNYYKGKESQLLAQTPMTGVWHDLFAFNKLYTVTYEKTTNGITWNSATLDTKIFSQKQLVSSSIIDRTTQVGARWTFSNVAWSSGSWIVIGYNYDPYNSTKQVLVESSVDGNSWTTRHISSYTNSSDLVYHYIENYSGSIYFRVTITKTDTGVLGDISINSLKLLTNRPGDQGFGSELQLPYTWDENMGVSFGNTLNLSAQTANSIASFDASKNIVALPTNTYPSLPELAYVKGVTSSIQTQLNGKQPVGSYEPSFTKNTAFNKNLGTTAGTVAEGNDSRINNGQTAFGWGNHAGLYRPIGYVPSWSEITSKPQTLQGYGIYNAVPHQDGSRYATDFNNILTSGFYNAESTPTNAPAPYGQLLTAKGIDTGLQIYGGYNNDNLWFRGWQNNGSAFTPWRKILHDGNYNSFSPTLTGTNATGTWPISITGLSSLASQLNVYAGNEAIISNGFSGGELYVNYRGSSGAITNYRFVNGLSTGAYTNVTAASFVTAGGTSSQYVKGDGSLSSTVPDSRPYKVYTAILNQSGTSVPTAIVLENTLGQTPTWSRNQIGQYTLTVTGSILTLDKTISIISNGWVGTAVTNSHPVNANSVVVDTYSTIDSSGRLDNLLSKTPIEIRVYN